MSKDVLSPQEIWKEVEKEYEWLNTNIHEDNVMELRERLARVTEKLPKAAKLRCDAEYVLSEFTEKYTVKILSENPKMLPTIFRNILKGRLKGHERVFNMARKLHQDLESHGHNIRALLGFEVAAIYKLDGGKERQPKRRSGQLSS